MNRLLEYSVSRERLLSRRQGDPVGPNVDKGFTVEVVKVGHDWLLEFCFRGDAGPSAPSSTKTFDQAEPGTVVWREDKCRIAITLSGEPLIGFLGHMRRMIVQQDL